MKLDRRDLWKKEEAELRKMQTWKPIVLRKSTISVERRAPTEFGRRAMPDDEIDDVKEPSRSNRMGLFMRILGI